MNKAWVFAPLIGIVVAAAPQTPQTPNGKHLTVICYWQNFAEFVSSKFDNRIAKTGCEKYKDPTHCERTAPEMFSDAINGKRDWERVTSNGLIYTVSCRHKCKKILGPGQSYDAETDGKLMRITIEMPNNKNLVETFEVFDVSPMKEPS